MHLIKILLGSFFRLSSSSDLIALEVVAGNEIYHEWFKYSSSHKFEIGK